MRRTLHGKGTPLKGTLSVPGDKSISHRALILAALGETPCELRNLSPGQDVRSTARCLHQLGVTFSSKEPRRRPLGLPLNLSESLTVRGVGLHGLRAPRTPLDCGNSGTTMRLLSGMIAGSAMACVLDGDESLRQRPMKRVLAPLRAMGAHCSGRRIEGKELAPLRFDAGAWLVGRRQVLEVASAQVKSALLLAGLWAEGRTTVVEPIATRDHTERMLAALGVSIEHTANEISVEAPKRLELPDAIDIPGDPSSAAFLLGAALLEPQSVIRVEGVDANPTRIGFVDILRRMGARIDVHPEGESAGDPVSTFEARGGAKLRGTTIHPEEIPSLIDELPLLMALAAHAEGRTEIRGARELRVKESDRIAAMAEGLRALGADVEELPDGMILEGGRELKGGKLDAAGDHRIAMSLAVAALGAEGPSVLEGAEWVDVSFPGFFDRLDGLRQP